MELQPLLPCSCMHLSELPEELLVTIFQQLPTFDQITLAKTSKKLLRVFIQNRGLLLSNLLLQNLAISVKTVRALRNIVQYPSRVAVKGLYIRSCGISRSSYERDFAILVYMFESTIERIDVAGCHPSSSVKGFGPKVELPPELDNEHTRFNGFDADEEENLLDRRNGYQRSQNLICYIGDGLMQAICLPWTNHLKCKNLSHLSLPLSKLHNSKLEEFVGRFKMAGIVNTLRHIDLSYISEIHDDALSNLFKQNPSLSCVKLASCLGLNGDCLYHLVENCAESIRELELGYCTELNADSSSYNLKRLLLRAKNLRKLDLTGTRQFQEAHWHQMLTKTGKLRELDLSVTTITSDNLLILGRSAQTLRCLNLNSCLNLSIASILKFAETRHSLTHLNICNNYEFGDEDLRAMLASNSSIVSVDVQWTEVSDECVDSLYRERPDVFLRHDLDW